MTNRKSDSTRIKWLETLEKFKQNPTQGSADYCFIIGLCKQDELTAIQGRNSPRLPLFSVSSSFTVAALINLDWHQPIYKPLMTREMASSDKSK